MLDDGVGSIVILDAGAREVDEGVDVESEEVMVVAREVAEDEKESEDVLELAGSFDVYVYLVNEYVDEDAVVVENAEKGLSVELELELELRLKLS
jgi:hypothetical protein